VVAGGGIHLSGAGAALARLQQAGGLAVATTNMGKGAVDEEHALSVGVIGSTMGTRSPTRHMLDYIKSADAILFVGSRTNENGTASWSLFPPTAQYIQIDMDPQELGRNYPALRLLGDADATLQALADALEQRDGSHRQGRAQRIAGQLAHARAMAESERAPYMQAASVPLRPERLLAEMGRIADAVTWVADASYSSLWLLNFLTCATAGSRYIVPRGIAGLGWGFPMAIGARLARPDAAVICLSGDGGFAHCWAELETARRHGVKVVVVVLNNGVLGFQRNAEESRFGVHTDVCHFGPIDHVAIARACGCDGLKVEHPDEIAAAFEQALAADVPFVLDVIVAPQAFPPITSFESQLEPLHE
jgi:acetolactate synthase-1/2/3 large subunit